MRCGESYPGRAALSWSAAMLLLSLALACAQTPPLELKPHWEIGPLMRLELVKGREDWEDDKLLKSSKTVTPIDVEVQAKSAAGWVMRWTFGHTSVIEGAGADKEFAERMVSLNEGMHLDVRISPAGGVDGLADPQGLQRHYARMLQEVEKGLLEKGVNTKIVAQVMQDSKERVLGPDFERSALTEVELFHRCFKVPLVPGKATEYEGQLANPFGGDPFPAVGHYQLDTPEKDAKTAAVHFTLALDPQKSRELILAWMNELATRTGKAPPQGLDDLPLKSIDETTDYSIDLANALPAQVAHVRTTVERKHKRIDRTLLRALPLHEKPR
jgi:hypothetical protein